MTISRISKVAISALSALAFIGSVAACAPGGTASSSNVKSEAASKDLGSEKITLTLWNGAGLKSFDEDLIKAFEAKYPNITVKGTWDPDNVSAQNGPRVISSADSPDVAAITDITSAVRGKHVISLEEYAKLYGWDIPESQTVYYRASSDGKVGAGDLYAVPDAVSMTGMYWNTKVAAQLGITEAPKSVEELEADMKLAKDAGITPMIMPAKEGGTSFIYQALWTNNSGKDVINNWILQKSGSSIDENGAVKAAEKIQEWAKAGYFSSDAVALDGTTALGRFNKGEGLFFPSGSWFSSSINEGLGADAGFFAYPGNTTDQAGSAASNAVTPYGIPANSKHKNAAAAFIDFTLSDEAQQLAVKHGYPAIMEGAWKSDNPVLNQILEAESGLVKANNTTNYINNATAAMQASGIIPNFQTLIDGSQAPAQFVQAIQKQWDSEVK
ncbi:ABC transporter substrate-binding protein [Alloscardovia macacae]|uniref:Sugar ABC transporter substrate-binding protein n=1 Tax=Alloscardovia macacae TaxID=1160091 RepID=A0A261F497_9BIFI|nr:extracellular solute-binding protein [Alloscardovia macacae]OZG53883.1 sugar ABC transporter substrate-binding protein [Alloscardovia macacae]